MNGHKTPDCDGQWIDISTFAERKELCAKCRATRRPVDEDHYQPPAFPAVEPTERPLAWSLSPYATLAGIILAVAVVAFIGGLLVNCLAR